MQKIKLGQIATFLAILLSAVVLAFVTTKLLFGKLPLGDFRGVVLVAIAAVFIYLYAIAAYRVFLYISPLEEGEVIEGSRQEFVAQVNTLFFIILFYPLIRTHFLPTPVLRLVYLGLGAHLGHNSYSGGAILDPILTHVGDDCIIGHDAVLYSHAIEGNRFSLSAIRIGHRVTIGAHAIVMSGVTIGDGAIVAAGSVVLKGTHIAAGESWGGIPARRLKTRSETESGDHSI